jgi:hypothetical protein
VDNQLPELITAPEGVNAQAYIGQPPPSRLQINNKLSVSSQKETFNLQLTVSQLIMAVTKRISDKKSLHFRSPTIIII